MKTKSKLVIQSIAIRDKAKAVIFWSKKEISKVKNALLQWIFQTILGSLTFRRIAKFIMVDFYEMDFMKGIVILVTVDEMYNILKSLSHCLLVKRWSGIEWSKFLLESDLQCPYVYYTPPLLRGSLHVVRDTAGSLILQYRWH